MKKAVITTAKGVIELELFDKESPKTVQNFADLAGKGFYDGCTFHRVIPDFMIQGGDPLSKELPPGSRQIGSGGPGYKIDCETAGNPRRHMAGPLSMAHAGPNTGGSQFFITVAATPWLDGKHAIFGKVIKGKDVVDAIAAGDKMESVAVVDA